MPIIKKISTAKQKKECRYLTIFEFTAITKTPVQPHRGLVSLFSCAGSSARRLLYVRIISDSSPQAYDLKFRRFTFPPLSYNGTLVYPPVNRVSALLTKSYRCTSRYVFFIFLHSVDSNFPVRFFGLIDPESGVHWSALFLFETNIFCSFLSFVPSL